MGGRWVVMARKSNTTAPRPFFLDDAPELAPEPFTVTGAMIREAINSWDGQLVANLLTGEVRVVSTMLRAGADDMPLGTGDELHDCYRVHTEPTIDGYAAHLTELLARETDGGRL